MNNDSKIIEKIKDSRIMKALTDSDVSKAVKFISTKQCKSCKKEIPIQEEICPECKAQDMNAAISLFNGVMIAFFIMFFILGFFMPKLWFFSIVSILVFIAVNKLKSRLS